MNWAADLGGVFLSFFLSLNLAEINRNNHVLCKIKKF